MNAWVLVVIALSTAIAVGGCELERRGLIERRATHALCAVTSTLVVAVTLWDVSPGLFLKVVAFLGLLVLTGVLLVAATLPFWLERGQRDADLDALLSRSERRETQG